MPNFSQALAAQTYQYLENLAKTSASANAGTMRPSIPKQPTAQDIPMRWAQSFMGPGLPLVPVGQPIPQYRVAPSREPRVPSRIVQTIPTRNKDTGEAAYDIRTEDGSYDFQFTPRSYQYPPNVNTTIVPRISYGLMSFAEIQELTLGTPDVRLCSRLLKREFCGLLPQVVHADGEVCDDEVLNRFVNYPDGHNPMSTWLGRWFFNGVNYDAPALYMVRDEKGQITGLVNVDGSTIFLIIDDGGNAPKPPAPAYLQIIYGTPFGFSSTNQLWYRPNDLQINSNYGTALVESANLPALLLNNIWRYQTAWFTAGTLPDAAYTAPPGWTNTQVAQWLIDKSEALAGHPELRAQFDVWPYGFQALVVKSVEFRKEVFDIAKREIMEHAGLPISEIGETPRQGLGGRGFMDAMGQALFRQAFLPWMTASAAPFNDVFRINARKCKNGQTYHEMEWGFPTQSIDPEKERQIDRDTFETGGMTLGEYREAVGQDRFDDERDDLIYLAKGGMLIRPDGTIFASVKGGDLGGALEPERANRTVKPSAAVPKEDTAAQQQERQKGDGREGTRELTDSERAGAAQKFARARALRRDAANAYATGKFGRAYELRKSAAALESDAREQLVKASPSPEATVDGVPVTDKFVNAVALRKAADRAGVMIALPVTEAVGRELLAQAREALVKEIELEPVDNLHITLAYLGDTSTARKTTSRDNLLLLVKAFAASHAPLEGRIGGIAKFMPAEDDAVPLVALFDCPELPAFWQDLIARLKTAGVGLDTSHGFVPHITLAYLPKDAADVNLALNSLPLRFTEIVLAWAGDWHAEPLALAKHCGVCPADDLYYGGTITHEVSIPMPHQGANVSEIVSVSKPGLPSRAFVWKPEGEEQPDLAEAMGHAQYVAGEAVWWVDRTLGFYLVPTTFVGEADGEVGSATMYVHGEDAKHLDEYASHWLEKAAVLNWITGEADQAHDPSNPNANFLTHPDEPQRPILYDFFLSFPTSTAPREMRSQFVDVWRGQPLSADVMDALNALKESSVWNRVEKLVGASATAEAHKRLDMLLERGMIPQEAES